MVIFMTSSSSSKTEFTCIFYDVFDVGGYAGSSLLEVSLLYILGIPPPPLLFISRRCWMLLVVIYPTSLSLLNSDLICRSCGSLGFIAFSVFSVVFLKASSGSTALSSGSTACKRQYRGPVLRVVLLLLGIFFSCRFSR